MDELLQSRDEWRRIAAILTEENRHLRQQVYDLSGEIVVLKARTEAGDGSKTVRR